MKPLYVFRGYQNFRRFGPRSPSHRKRSSINKMKYLEYPRWIGIKFHGWEVFCCRICFQSYRQQKCTSSQIRYFVSEAVLLNAHNLYSLGRTELIVLDNRLSIVSWTISMENPSCSRRRFYQGTPRWCYSNKSETWWRKVTFSRRDSRIEPSSCRCTTTLTGGRKGHGENCLQNSFSVLLHTSQGFPKDIGHSSGLDLKKNGTPRSLTNHAHISRKRASCIQRNESFIQRTSEKHRRWKNIDTLQRGLDDVRAFTFLHHVRSSAPYLRSHSWLVSRSCSANRSSFST